MEKSNNRHAYLILAHDKPKILQVLVNMIDDDRNDIFIHIDQRSNIEQFANIRTKYSNLYYTKRIRIYWGGYSMVKAELMLLQTARKYDHYLYYHLLSGVDLPLKSQDYIHHIFDEVYRGHEFVGLALNQDINNRVRYYHFFEKSFRDSGKPSLTGLYRAILLSLQKKLHICRNRDVAFFKGSQWFSITDDLCCFLLKNKMRIRKLFHHTICPDESFVQTLIYNSRFWDNIHNRDNEFYSCQRYIDWTNGPDYPHTWIREDWEDLISSDKLFARKFSEDDMEFVCRIKDCVTCIY